LVIISNLYSSVSICCNLIAKSLGSWPSQSTNTSTPCKVFSSGFLLSYAFILIGDIPWKFAAFRVSGTEPKFVITWLANSLVPTNSLLFDSLYISAVWYPC